MPEKINDNKMSIDINPKYIYTKKVNYSHAYSPLTYISHNP